MTMLLYADYYDVKRASKILIEALLATQQLTVKISNFIIGPLYKTFAWDCKGQQGTGTGGLFKNPLHLNQFNTESVR